MLSCHRPRWPAVCTPPCHRLGEAQRKAQLADLSAVIGCRRLCGGGRPGRREIGARRWHYPPWAQPDPRDEASTRHLTRHATYPCEGCIYNVYPFRKRTSFVTEHLVAGAPSFEQRCGSRGLKALSQHTSIARHWKCRTCRLAWCGVCCDICTLGMLR